jgi:hypothetical protein
MGHVTLLVILSPCIVPFARHCLAFDMVGRRYYAAGRMGHPMTRLHTAIRPICLYYQPPANNNFISKQIRTSHQPITSTLLSKQISISYQPAEHAHYAHGAAE